MQDGSVSLRIVPGAIQGALTGSLSYNPNKPTTKDLYDKLAAFNIADITDNNITYDKFKELIKDENIQKFIKERTKNVSSTLFEELFVNDDIPISQLYRYEDKTLDEILYSNRTPTKQISEKSIKEKVIEEKPIKEKPQIPLAIPKELENVIKSNPLLIPERPNIETLSKETPQGFWGNLGQTVLNLFTGMYELADIAKGLSPESQIKAVKTGQAILNRIGYTAEIATDAINGDWTLFEQTQKGNDALLKQNLINIKSVYDKLDPEGKELFKEQVSIYPPLKNWLDKGKLTFEDYKDIVKELGWSSTRAIFDADKILFGGILTGSINVSDMPNNTKLAEKLESLGYNPNQVANAVQLAINDSENGYHSKAEFLIRQMMQVFLISASLIRGYKSVKGLGTRQLTNLEGKFAKEVIKDGGKVVEGEQVGKFLGNNRINKALYNKNGELVAIIGNRKDLMSYKFNKFIESGTKTLPYHLPRIANEIETERESMELRGVEIEPGWYAGGLLFKTFEAYAENLGEYTGTLLQPYTDRVLQNFIKNKTTRSLTNHFLINPLSESLEERVTDIVTEYIPRIFQGQSPETLDNLKRKLVTEFITFIPLGINGAVLEKRLESLNKQLLEKAKNKQVKFDKDAVKEFSNLIANLAESDKLTEEEKELLNLYAETGFTQLITDLTSKETQAEIDKIINEKQIEKPSSEEINKTIDKTEQLVHTRTKQLKTLKKEIQNLREFKDIKTEEDALLFITQIEIAREKLIEIEPDTDEKKIPQLNRNAISAIHKNLNRLQIEASKKLSETQQKTEQIINNANNFYKKIFGENYNPTNEDYNIYLIASVKYKTDKGQQLKETAVKTLADKIYNNLGNVDTGVFEKETQNKINKNVEDKLSLVEEIARELPDTRGLNYVNRIKNVKTLEELTKLENEINQANQDKVTKTLKTKYLSAIQEKKKLFKRTTELEKLSPLTKDLYFKLKYLNDNVKVLNGDIYDTLASRLIDEYYVEVSKTLDNLSIIDKKISIPGYDMFGTLVMSKGKPVKNEAIAIVRLKNAIESMPDYDPNYDRLRKKSRFTDKFVNVFKLSLDEELQADRLDDVISVVNIETTNNIAQLLGDYFSQKLGYNHFTIQKDEKGKTVLALKVGSKNNATRVLEAIRGKYLSDVTKLSIKTEGENFKKTYKSREEKIKEYKDSVKKLTELLKEAKEAKDNELVEEATKEIEKYKRLINELENRQKEIKSILNRYTKTTQEVSKEVKEEQAEEIINKLKKYKEDLSKKSTSQLLDIIKSLTKRIFKLREEYKDYIDQSFYSDINKMYAYLKKLEENKITYKSEEHQKTALIKQIIYLTNFEVKLKETAEKNKKEKKTYSHNNIVKEKTTKTTKSKVDKDEESQFDDDVLRILTKKYEEYDKEKAKRAKSKESTFINAEEYEGNPPTEEGSRSLTPQEVEEMKALHKQLREMDFPEVSLEKKSTVTKEKTNDNQKKNVSDAKKEVDNVKDTIAKKLNEVKKQSNPKNITNEKLIDELAAPNINTREFFGIPLRTTLGNAILQYIGKSKFTIEEFYNIMKTKNISPFHLFVLTLAAKLSPNTLILSDEEFTGTIVYESMHRRESTVASRLSRGFIEHPAVKDIFDKYNLPIDATVIVYKKDKIVPYEPGFVLLHEIGHVITVDAISNNETIYNDALNFIKSIGSQLREKLEYSRYKLIYDLRLRLITEGRYTDNEIVDEKLMVKEFFADALAHPDIIIALNEIEYENKTALQKVKELITDALIKALKLIGIEYNRSSASAYFTKLINRMISYTLSEYNEINETDIDELATPPKPPLIASLSDYKEKVKILIPYIRELIKISTDESNNFYDNELYQRYKKLEAIVRGNTGSINEVIQSIKTIFDNPAENFIAIGAIEVLLRMYNIVPPIKNELRLNNFNSVQQLQSAILNKYNELQGKDKIEDKTVEEVSQTVEPAKDEKIETVSTKAADEGYQEIPPDTLPIVDINNELNNLIVDESAGIIIEHSNFLRSLGVLIAKVTKDYSYINIYRSIKNKQIDLQRFISLFNDNTPEGKELSNIIKTLWTGKYRLLIPNYEEFKRLSLTKVYNMIKYRSHKSHISIHLSKIGSQLMKTITNLTSNKLVDSEGNKISTLMYNTPIESILSRFESLFGLLELVYIGELKIENKRFELNTFQSVKDFEDLMFETGYLVIGKAADKSELPVFRLTSKAYLDNYQIIYNIYKTYAKYAGAKTQAEISQVLNSVLTYLIYEATHGGNIEKIMTGNFDINDSAILSKTVKNNKYKEGSIFKILKRVPFILQMKRGSEDLLIDRLGITSDPKTSPVNGVFYQIINNTKKLFFNHFTVSTSNIEGLVLTIDNTQYKLEDLLFNEYGTELTDGLSLVLYSPDKDFMDVYNEYFGEIKRGSLKNFLFKSENNNSKYLKHSVQYVSANDIIGKWMLQNNIAMLSFESAQKIGKPNGTLADFQKQDTQIVPEPVSFEYLSHDMVKGAIQKRVRALRQVVTSAYLAPKSRSILNVKNILKHLDTIVSNNMKTKIKEYQNEMKIKKLFEKMKEVVSAPNGFYENNIANAFPFLKEMTFEQFKSNYKYLIKHPMFADYINAFTQDYMEGIFSIELSKGSSLTLVADLGILANGRLKVIKRNIEKLGLNIDDVLTKTGRLKEGYVIISKNYAESKGVKLGDKVVHSLVPTDSPLGINSSTVIAILDERLIPPGSIVANSEYVQSIIGRDFDIDVLYIFSRDENIMDEKNWEDFNNEIVKMQQSYRETYLKAVQKVVSSNPVIMKKLAESLNIPLEQFTIDDFKVAMNAKVQEAYMIAIYGESGYSSLNPFEEGNIYKLTSLFNKLIGKEVQNRTHYTTYLNLGVKIKVKLKNTLNEDVTVIFNPNNPDQPLMDIKHTIATNDTVDLPNRENFFNYNYSLTRDILTDYLGLKNADNIPITEENDKIINDFVMFNNLLWGDYMSIVRGKEVFSHIEKNTNTFVRRLKRAKKIISLLETGKYDELKKLLYNIWVEQNAYVDRSLEIKLSKSKQAKTQSIESVISKFVDGIKEAMGDEKITVKNHPLLNAIKNFNENVLHNVALSRANYFNIENKIKETIINNSLGNKYIGKSNEEMLKMRDNDNIKDKKYNSDILSFMWRVIQASLRPQREILETSTGAQIQANTEFGKARLKVFPYILNHLLTKEDLAFRESNIKEKFLNQMRLSKEEVNTYKLPEIVDIYIGVNNNELFFVLGVNNKKVYITLDQYLGNTKLEGQMLNNVKYLRKAISSTNLWSRPSARGVINEIIPFGDEVDPLSNRVSVVGNLTTRDGYIIVKKLIDELKENVAEGKIKLDEKDYLMLAIAFIGGISDPKSARLKTPELGGNYIGNIKDPGRVKEILEGKSEFEIVDYSHSGDYLELAEKIYPGFSKMYSELFNQMTSASEINSIYDMQIDNLEVVMSDINEETYYDISDNETIRMKKFLSFFHNKHSIEKLNQNSVTLAVKFIKKLVSSPAEAYKDIQDFLMDIALLHAIYIENPQGITHILKDLKELGYENFAEKYKNLEVNFDAAIYAENNLLEEFGLTKNEKNELENPSKKKLFAIFTTLLGIRNSYLKNYNRLLKPVKDTFYNIEMYAIKHGKRVYWDKNDNDPIGVLPLFTLDKSFYDLIIFRKKHIKALMYEYINPFIQNEPSLTDEFFFRIDKLDQYIKILDKELNDKLGAIANVIRVAAKEINNNKAYEFDSDAVEHINRNAYDIAEKFFVKHNIRVEKIKDKYYFVYKDEYYSLETSGKELSLVDKFFPEIQIDESIKVNSSEYIEMLNEKAERDIIRASLKAAMYIRVILDYDSQAIINIMNEYILYAKRFAKKTGNEDLANSLEKIREGYNELFEAMLEKEGSYMPRYWNKYVYTEAYKDYLRDIFTEDYIEKHPEANENELEAAFDKYVAEKLALLKEDGIMMAFNPNAMKRKLPDWFEGYEKDIFYSMNNYLSNMKSMIIKDIAKVEYMIYMIKARMYGEDPYVIDTMKKFYARKSNAGNLRTKIVDIDKVGKGKEVEFITIEKDKLDDEAHEVTKSGYIVDINDKEVSFKTFDNEIVTYKLDEIYIYDDFGNKLTRKFKVHIETGLVEKLGKLAKEFQAADKNIRGALLASVYFAFEKFLNIVNYSLTMSVLGTLSQLPAYFMQVIGGTIMNINRNPIQNIRYIRSLKDFQRDYPEEYENILTMLGLYSNDFMMDMATFGDLQLSKLGVNESYVNAVKQILKNIGTSVGLLNKDITLYQNEIRKLRAEYNEKPSKQLRRKMYEVTLDYLNRKHKKGYLTKIEYNIKINKIRKIFDYAETKLPIDEDAKKTISTWREFKALKNIIMQKFNQSYMGLKLFQKPEKMLRLHSFIIGYNRANRILGGTDKRLAIEYGLSFVKAKQKYYSSVYKQLGAMTKLGLFIFKFAQFVYDEIIRERKNINAAFRTILFGNFTLSSYLKDTIEKDGKKIKIPIGENSAKQYINALMFASILSNLDILFGGLGNFGNPVKDFQLKLLKMLFKVLNKEKIKLDYETVAFIRGTMSMLGLGYGGTLIPNFVMYENSKELQKGSHPLIPRAYLITENIYDLLDYTIKKQDIDKVLYGKNYTDFQKEKKIDQLQRRLTGINILGGTYDKNVKNIEGIDKLKEIYKRPQNYLLPLNRELNQTIELFR